MKDQYTNQFELAEKTYWLPTYLTRENPEQAVLSPQELTTTLTNPDAIDYKELNDELWAALKTHLNEGSLVLCMGAGSIDSWVREHATSL